MTKPGARGLAAFAAAWLAGSAALAGDIASIRPLGFSADGSVFAFEEFGIQDGSGFPYSNIFAIDTVKDAYIDGTPVRVRIDDEAAGLGKARSEASAKAAALLAPYAVEDHPGQLVALNPISEASGNTHTVRYFVHPAEPPVGAVYGLRLEEIAQEPSAACKDIQPKVRSFRLLLTSKEGKPANQKLYQDDGVPDSRNCPSGYRLGGVMTYTPPSGGTTLHMALVLVLGVGFEGRDGRWIAIPLRP